MAFVILFSAPGNEIRVASEIANWMPEYETMPFGQHVFITIHWLLSSFANENKLFLCGIWDCGNPSSAAAGAEEKERLDRSWDRGGLYPGRIASLCRL